MAALKLSFLLLLFLTSATLCSSFEPRNHEGMASQAFRDFSWLLLLPFEFWFLGFVAVEALITIREALYDPHGALNNWDGDSVDPCSWAMITCSPENFVIGL